MIIDVHAHIGRMGCDYQTAKPSEYVDAAAVIRNMDRLQIDVSFLLCLSDTPEGWYLKSNTEDIISACAEYPDRLIPFCLIDPRFGGNSSNADFSILLEEYVERGCKGFGEVVVKMYFDEPRLMNLYRQVGRYNLPVLFDMNVSSHYGVLDEPDLSHLENALRVCPETVFIGHGPTFWTRISDDEHFYGYPEGPIKGTGAAIRLLNEYDNFWADISAGSGYNAVTRDRVFGIEFLDRFAHKLLFGTDITRRDEESPILDYMNQVKNDKKISADKYDMIMSANAVKLFNL